MKIVNLFGILLFGLSYPNCAIFAQETQTPTNARVIIIGAGISGYASAARLMDRGIDDIIILEAENRIGGRLHSIPYGNGFIDLGGQWVHGEAGNSIYELVNEANAFQFGDTGFDHANYFFHQSDGVALNQTHVNFVLFLAHEILNDYHRMVMDLGSLSDYFHREFWRRVQRPEFREVSSHIIIAVEHFMSQTICNYYGTHNWNRLQTRQHVVGVEAEGNQYLTWRDRGYRTLFDIVQSPRADTSFDVTDRVQLNKVVNRIHWNPQEGRPRIECTDNTQYTADHIIVTIPLGVLKLNHATLFNPQLPSWKVSAIEHIEVGTLEKVILEFAQPFWPVNDNNWVQYSILWSSNDVDALRGTDREWLIDVTYIVRYESFPNLLQFFLIGRRFENYEFINNAEIAQGILWLLRRMLNVEIPAPSNIWRSSWISQPNFRGGYVYFSIDSNRHGVTPALMGGTINVDNTPRLLFAGEATDDFYGYANGALSSGYRVADEIADYNDGNRLSSISVQWFVASVILVLFFKIIN